MNLRSNKHAPKTRNPRSEMQVVGSRNEHLRARTSSKDAAVRHRDTSTDYPCPKCGFKMFKDEDIDFGTVTTKNGSRKTGKYHRECPPWEGYKP